MANFKFNDITGKVFGHLTALAPTDQRKGNSKCIIWKCACNCGNYLCPKVVYIRSDLLRSKASMSCLQQRTKQAIAISIYYSNTRSRANFHNFTFDLSMQDFHNLIRMPCHYCNDKSDIKQIRNHNTRLLLRANGIDRVNNLLGYVISNCVPCCEMCNRSKGTNTAQEYLNHCRKVVLHNVTL